MIIAIIVTYVIVCAIRIKYFWTIKPKKIMETLEIFVENIKCGGCMSGIKKALMEFKGVKSVEIDLDEEKIQIQGDNLDREAYVQKMDGMGYPEKGQNTLFKEAKSYVSCAIGKVTS